jgi:hypothetical protein
VIAAGYPGVGSHAITAIYSGDDNNLGSFSPALTESVNPATTTTVLSSSANPSVAGQSVTYSATVSPAADLGTVAFSDGGTVIPGCEATVVDPATGVATCTPATYQALGVHSLTAAYSGDPNFLPSLTSQALAQTVNQATTTSTISSSQNPSLVGGQVTYTATVSAGAIGGTVDFTDGGVTIAGCGAVPVIAVSDTASCQATYSAAGAASIGASYTGNAAYASSDAGLFTQQVNVVPPIVTPIAPPIVTPSPTLTKPTPVPTPLPVAPLIPAPPSPGVAVATVGAPASGLVAAAAGLTVTATTGTNLRGSVTVPAGGLPAGTVLSVYPIPSTAPVARAVPSGQSYVLSFDVSWRAPDGSSPASSKPIRITITSPKITAGETVYQLSSTGLTAVGIAAGKGTATVTFEKDPAFVIASLTGARLTLADHQPARIVGYEPSVKARTKVTAQLIRANRVIRTVTIRVAATHQIRWNTPVLSTGTYRVRLLIGRKVVKTTTVTVQRAVVVKKKKS